jgi:Putative cyclase
MATEAQSAPTLGELLKDAPRNWGRWGDDDEVGALNYLTTDEVLRGVKAVQKGKVFTLQVPMGDPEGDPTWPGRTGAQRWMVIDKGHYIGGKGQVFPGEIEYADDVLFMFLQGSTQYDALGHTWFGDQIYNGYDARTTIGGLEKASVLPIAERGVVGHGVLVDVARHRGKDVLDKGETFTHEDLVAAAESQGTSIEKHDILVVRTGFIGASTARTAASSTRTSSSPG